MEWVNEMDANITKVFENMVNIDFRSAVISNSKDKNKICKIKIRPVLIKGELLFQLSEYVGNQIFHSNLSKELLLEKLPEWFEGLFHQAEINSKAKQVILLISKKGKATIKYKDMSEIIETHNEKTGTETTSELFLHNKKKNYILEEGMVHPFLYDLGIMTKDGAVVKSKMDKFKQINRYLEYIEDVLPYLAKDRELTILDFGCGKSYLTFAMYYYLKEIKGYRINIIGLDLKQDVIQKCNALSIKYGYDKLKFLHGDIASYDGNQAVDMVVTLHACDTATDHALFKAVSWGAKVILSVPCCQHELNIQIHSDTLEPLFKYGIIKERMSALITDALRAELLESMGYRVQLLEFIDMEHTPKNILIRAVKRDSITVEPKAKEEKLKECMEFLGVSPCLYHLLQKETVKERE
ncbi:MAG: hypothetical protein K0S76_2531 [Herbinix sp.]|jgi:SAM-dependent methyltransferase|nr:hypothetical protein [Herbinix sp.]